MDKHVWLVTHDAEPGIRDSASTEGVFSSRELAYEWCAGEIKRAWAEDSDLSTDTVTGQDIAAEYTVEGYVLDRRLS